MNNWISIRKRVPEPGRRVDIWMEIYASPRSFGMGDSFRVIEAWRENGKWFHRHEGKVKELYNDYVTHWMPMPKAPKRIDK